MDIQLTSLLAHRLLIAALFGGLVGLEREWRGRPAGLRTNLIIALGSCLFTILSIYGFERVQAMDPGRVAAQIVTGVGFLGAGALIQRDGKVRGLTTAADIWLVSAIGMTVAVGMIGLATFVTLLSIAALYFLAPLSKWIEENGNGNHEAEELSRSRIEPMPAPPRRVTIAKKEHRSIPSQSSRRIAGIRRRDASAADVARR